MKTSRTYDIFISYRHEGGSEIATHLYDLLVGDGYTVSFDKDNLRRGDFDVELLKRVRRCKDFILILNKGALDPCPNKQAKEDWLHNELACALENKKNVIPVMLDGFTSFPDVLPVSIANVRTKLGPKYNKDFFPTFYSDLKNNFLKTKRSMKTVWFLIFGLFLLFFCAGFLHAHLSERNYEKIVTIASQRMDFFKDEKKRAIFPTGDSVFFCDLETGEIQKKYKIDLKPTELTAATVQISEAGYLGIVVMISKLFDLKTGSGKERIILYVGGTIAIVCGYGAGYWANIHFFPVTESSAMEDFLKDKKNWIIALDKKKKQSVPKQ